jgi:hypothetical protein
VKLYDDEQETRIHAACRTTRRAGLGSTEPGYAAELSPDNTSGLMSNSLSLARSWTEFIAARPEFLCAELLLRQFSAGEVTRLCDCGCNSYDIAVPRDKDFPPLVAAGERGGSVFQLEFNTNKLGKTVGFTLFVDKDGYLAGLDVDYCGNSFRMPENLTLSEPPFHVHGVLSHPVMGLPSFR